MVFRFSGRTSLGALAGWLGGVAGAVTLLETAGLRRLIPPALIESLFILLVLLLWASCRNVQELLAAIGRAGRLATVIVVGLVVAAQGASQSERTYPLADWRMYGEPVESTRAAWVDFQGVFADGTRSISIGATVPSLDRWRLYLRLSELASSGGDEAVPEELVAALRAVGRLHNRKHPQRPLRAIRVERVEFDTASAPYDLAANRREICRVQIAGKFP